MADLEVQLLLKTESISVRHVVCSGACRHRSPDECTSATHLVFPHRGVYLRHVGSGQYVADANHVQFFNAGEGYQISHPVDGGDQSLVIVPSEQLLRELAPSSVLVSSGVPRFNRQHQRIDPRTQALVALIRHGLTSGALEGLEAETMILTLISRSLGPRTSHHPEASHVRTRLVDRVKLLLASDLGRRWSLGEIAAEIGGSPVYLTQVFQQVEGMPLYRYQLWLRLARGLDLVPHRDDLAALALELGFASHSHFTTAFTKTFGRSPSEFKRTACH